MLIRLIAIKGQKLNEICINYLLKKLNTNNNEVNQSSSQVLFMVTQFFLNLFNIDEKSPHLHI